MPIPHSAAEVDAPAALSDCEKRAAATRVMPGFTPEKLEDMLKSEGQSMGVGFTTFPKGDFCLECWLRGCRLGKASVPGFAT